MGFWQWLFGDKRAKEMGDPARNPLAPTGMREPLETWEEYRERIRSERTPAQNRAIARELRVGADQRKPEIEGKAMRKAEEELREAARLRIDAEIERRRNPPAPRPAPDRASSYASSRGGYVGLRRESSDDSALRIDHPLHPLNPANPFGVFQQSTQSEPSSLYGRSHCPPSDSGSSYSGSSSGSSSYDSSSSSSSSSSDSGSSSSSSGCD